MAYQLSDIVTRVRQRIDDTSYDSTEIKNYLNDTIRDVFNEYRLPLMQTSQNYTLNTSSSDITNGSGLPSNFVQAIKLTVTTSGQEKDVTWIDYKELIERYADPDDTTLNPAAAPSYVYKFGTTIKVFPKPDSAYTVTLYYIKEPTALANDSDVPEIPSEFEELLVVGAAYRCLQVKDNYDQAGILENKYMELLDKLVARYSQTQVGSAKIMRINRFSSSGSFFGG